MARNYKNLTLIVGGLFILAVIIFVTHQAISTEDALIVGYMQISAHAPVIAAKELGIYEKYGLNVKLESFPDTPTLMKAVESGQVDVGYQLTADIVLNSASKGKKYFIYFVERSTEESPIDGFYAMKNLTTESLRNEKIGHFPGPTGAVMTKRILEKVYKLKEGDYTIVPTAPPLQIPSLKSGEIVALFTYEPIGTLAVKAGAKRVLKAPVEKYILEGPWNGGIGIFTEDLVLRRKSVAVAFQKAIYETTRTLKKEKRGFAAEFMAKMQAGLDTKTALDVPVTETVIAFNKEDEAKLIVALEKEIHIYQELGLLPSEGRSNLKIFSAEK